MRPTVTYKSRIPQIMAALKPNVEKAMREGAEEIANEAKSRVPVGSGDLRDAIHVEETDEGLSIMAGDDQVFYGHMVENGTTHSAARPFLVPAYEANRDRLDQLIEDALEGI